MPKCSSGCIIEGMRTLKNFKLLKWMNQTGVRKVQPTSMQKAVQDAKFAIEATRPLSMQSPKFVEEAQKHDLRRGCYAYSPHWS